MNITRIMGGNKGDEGPAGIILQWKHHWTKLNLVNLIPHGIFTLQVPRGGGGVNSTNPQENPIRVVYVQFFLNTAKLLYNCRSHAKGESQEFKIEEL